MAKLSAIGVVPFLIFRQSCASVRHKTSQPSPAECWDKPGTMDAPYMQPDNANMPYPKWGLLWDEIIQAGNEKGCNAELIQSVPSSASFGAKMWYRVTAIWIAMLDGGVSYAWDNSSSFAQAWWSYFQNDAGIALPHGCNFSDSLYLRDFNYERLAVAARCAAHVDRHYMAALHHFAVKKIWTLRPHVKHAITATLASALGESFAQRHYIGVDVRVGDVSQDVPQSLLLLYMDKILATAASLGINTAFLVSSDPTAVRKLRELLAGRITIVNTREVEREMDETLKEVDAGSQGPSVESAEMLPLLADITGLQLAKAFIGMSSSTLGRLVYWLRGEEKITVTVDGVKYN